MRRPLANALDIDLAGGLTDQVTPHAGSALLIELGRRSGVIGAAERHLPATQSAKGLRQGELVEAFVVLSALGGECLDDVEQLRRDRGLAARLGYDLPAASTARHRLDQFHDPVAVSGRPQPGSFSPAERAGLAGLRAVVEHSVRTSCAAVPPGPMVTLDVDAHLVEASKQSALRTYEGCRGYQPLLVSWAETGLVVADEVRDGNVPARPRIKELVDQAAAALPQRSADDPWQVSVRSDSAAYEPATLDHWHTRRWRCAVSADLSPALQREIVALPPEVWTGCGQETTGVIREWAEVAYVPSRTTETQAAPVYRELRKLETLGVCRRGYFIEGLGGAQFALPGAVERLREKPEEEPTLVLAAADPAQPYGAALPWPKRSGARAARVAGAHVVLIGGEAALFVERGGRSLVPLRDPEEDWLRTALTALVAHARAAGLKRLAVERFDGSPVGETEVMPLLLEAGFLAGPRRAVLRA